MTEEETILEGWDLHLTIQKLQAPALSGMQLQQMAFCEQMFVNITVYYCNRFHAFHNYLVLSMSHFAML